MVFLEEGGTFGPRESLAIVLEGTWLGDQYGVRRSQMLVLWTSMFLGKVVEQEGGFSLEGFVGCSCVHLKGFQAIAHECVISSTNHPTIMLIPIGGFIQDEYRYVGSHLV
jgi:hypothetical protein